MCLSKCSGVIIVHGASSRKTLQQLNYGAPIGTKKRIRSNFRPYWHLDSHFQLMWTALLPGNTHQLEIESEKSILHSRNRLSSESSLAKTFTYVAHNTSSNDCIFIFSFQTTLLMRRRCSPLAIRGLVSKK